MRMDLELKRVPRKFKARPGSRQKVSDCGKIHLRADEQITLVTVAGKEYDVTAKAWGFYATPSVNSRLLHQGFRTALVRNPEGKVFVMIVAEDCLKEFQSHLKKEKQEILEWLHEHALSNKK